MREGVGMALTRIPLSLRSKLTLAFLLVLLPVLGLVVYSHLQEYQRARELALQEELRTAEAVGATVEAVLDRGVSVGRTLAVDPVIRDFSNRRREELQDYLARYLPIFLEYSDINVWASDGSLITSAVRQEPGEPLPNISDHWHFRQTMSSSSPTVSPVIISPVVGEPVVAIAAPIMDDAGSPLGVISVLLNVEQVTRICKKWIYPVNRWSSLPMESGG